MNDKILLIEDDLEISEMLKSYLTTENYEVICAIDGQEACNYFDSTDFSLVLLDLMIPKISGMDVMQHIRKNSVVPIIIVSAKDTETDKTLGLSLGADDYITKPFNIKVVMQRIQAVLRRVEGTSHDTAFTCGNLTIDFETHTVKKSGETLSLTPTEFKLLYVFVKNSGMALTRSLLLEKLWDNEGNFVDEHALTSTISRVRNKIENSDHAYIKTVYGMGYMWIGGGNK